MCLMARKLPGSGLRAVMLMLMFIVSQACFAASLEKALEAYDFEEYENAFIWLKPWANDGEAEAQYRLGLLYENGYGVDVNAKNALKWFRLAADQGHSKAKRRLRNLQKSATADVGNESVATQWYQDLADSGDSEAQYNLGFMHETGWSVPVDEVEAARWYEKAADKNISEAQFRLGLMYMVGAGVKQSEIQSERWIREAAKKKHKVAVVLRDKLLDASDLVRLNIKNEELYPRIRKLSAKSPSKAIAKIRETVSAAEKKVAKEKTKKRERLAKIQSIKSATAQNIFSEDDLLGPGGRKTFRWFKYKAENGDAEAQFKLGELFETGVEVKHDMKQAANWYTLAAEQGYTQSQYYIGMWYANGIVVTQNEDLASGYLSAAANKGHDKANTFLERTKAGRLVDNSETIAAWWLRQHASRGSASAKLHLARLYENGRGVKKDIAIARRLYELAAKQGNIEAVKKFSRFGTALEKPAASIQDVEQKIAQAEVDSITLNQDEDENSIFWYLTVSLVLLAPILGFFLVLRREKSSSYEL